jgi:DNA-binding beta-propeller fold protein YncE
VRGADRQRTKRPGSAFSSRGAGGLAALLLATLPIVASIGAAAAKRPLHHYLYVVPDGQIDVYDADHGFQQIDTIRLPQARGIRGVAAAAATRLLFVSYGPDSDAGGGHLLAYDLVARRVVWDRKYSFGIDSMALSRDGRTIFMPTGELATRGDWKVISTDTGDVVTTIAAGRGPHNTVVGQSGKWVYLGPRSDNYLYVASTTTFRVARKVGPLVSGVRPFTVNGRETLAYTTATRYLGFQISSLQTGRVLYTVPVRGFWWNPATYAPSAPSHGIALSPNEKRLAVIDGPNSYVHVYDVSRVPRRAPRKVADVPLSPLTGNESPCLYDCARDGWLEWSRDGRFLYAGDAGDVLNAHTWKRVAVVPALRNSRKFIELWWRGGAIVYAGARASTGHVVKKRR